MKDLQSYRDKRNFSQTAEPKGKRNVNRSGKLKFVVQRHHARHLHYDFRLELAGVLKSWAVPKGPSMNPKDKRLAVQVEDHPVDYASFEGTIAVGNYGAGTVRIFDSGYYDLPEGQDQARFLEALQRGHISFVLHGHLLKGQFSLVRLKQGDQKNWLLVKMKDKFAVDTAFNAEDFITAEEKGKSASDPYTVSKDSFQKKRHDPAKAESQDSAVYKQVMLAKLQEKLPSGDDWIFEKKYDGFRILSNKQEGEVRLFSRNGNEMNEMFPSVVRQIEQITRTDFVLDGEVVVEDRNGQSHFQAIQHGEPVPAGMTIKYYVFDLLRLEGNDLRTFSLEQRSALLKIFLTKYGDTIIRPADEIVGSSADILKRAEKNHWEGVIAKRKASLYHAAKRTADWVKVKFHQSVEAIICGFTTPKGSRKYFGSIVLGYYNQQGDLVYIGNCGTGFTESTLKELDQLFRKHISDTSPFSQEIAVARAKEVTWMTPELVCEIYYSEWTADKHLRHPVFKGMRLDKGVNDINLAEMRQKNVPGMTTDEVKIDGITVPLSNLDKVYWPEEGYTKGQMLAYYEKFGPLMLPFLRDKPLSLNRFPNGIHGKSFFQKDVDLDNIPKWVKTYSMFSDSSERMVDYIVCNNLQTLLYVANLGSIEINPWLSSYDKPDYPAFAVLDMDPHEVDFDKVVDIANAARALLESAGITPYVKTSGSTGLHIYMYVDSRYQFEVVKDFVQVVATLLHEKFPDLTSVERSKNKRKGLLYLDFLQNRRGQTIAAPYALRPRDGAPISTPLHWEEVRHGLRISDYTLTTIGDRFTKTDPWKEIWTHPVDIKKALAKF